MYETIDEALREHFYRNEEVAARIGEFEKMVLADIKVRSSRPVSC